MREPNPVTRAAMASDEPVFRQVGVGPWQEEHPEQPMPMDPRYDLELLEQGDRRNVLDRYRYWKVEAIRDDLDRRGRHDFEVAVENWTHDFNIGSMVRTANAFAARRVHIVGPHKWNRKGSLMTELYQHVVHDPDIATMMATLQEKAAGRGESVPRMIAIDNVSGAVPMETYHFPRRCLLMFGAEGPGLSEKALELADDVVYISQFGSVRSINAGAAAAVAMHSWIRQHARVADQSDQGPLP